MLKTIPFQNASLDTQNAVLTTLPFKARKLFDQCQTRRNLAALVCLMILLKFVFFPESFREKSFTNFYKQYRDEYKFEIGFFFVWFPPYNFIISALFHTEEKTQTTKTISAAIIITSKTQVPIFSHFNTLCGKASLSDGLAETLFNAGVKTFAMWKLDDCDLIVNSSIVSQWSILHRCLNWKC